MPVVSSRVKEGVLSFGGATPRDFSCQPSNIRLTPTANLDDPLEVLCGDIITGAGTTSWQLQGTAVQDFDDPNGFILFAFQNDGEEVAFSWTPNATGGTWSGNCFVSAIEVGGDVNTRLTADFVFALRGAPEYTP
jgi:hypothetical protein